jgi:hypothetical protein
MEDFYVDDDPLAWEDALGIENKKGKVNHALVHG